MLENPPLTVPEIGVGVPLERLAESACRSGRLHIAGAAGGSLAPLAVELAAARRAPLVVVAPEALRAAALASDLAFHSRARSDMEVLLFLPHDVSPYDEVVPDRDTALSRAATLFRLIHGQGLALLVASADAVLRRLLPRPAFEAGCLEVAVGDRIDRDELAAALTRAGFHHAPLVEEPGTFAVRGSLVDFFPPSLELPVRIDLFGPDVERIRSFDPASQATMGDLESTWLHPVRLAAPPTSAAARQRAEGRLREICDAVDQPSRRTAGLIEDVLGGGLLVGAEGFLPAFHDGLGALFDYVPADALVCLENPAAIRLAWQKLDGGFRADFERRRAAGLPCFSVPEHLLAEEEALAALGARPVVNVHPLAVEEPGDDVLGSSAHAVDLNAAATADLGERLRNLTTAADRNDLVGPLASHLATLADQGFRVQVAAHTAGLAERLAAMLRGRGLDVRLDDGDPRAMRPGVVVTVGELARGCVLPGDGVAWIAEEEVFGRRTRRKRSPAGRRAELDDIRTLKPGDLVVHDEHGVGRYEGLTRQRVRGAEVDFLLIAYRDGDKLYLPVHRLNQVQKYHGGEGERRLDKLGGQTFAKAVAEVKKAAHGMAEQLLHLYAKRRAASRTPLPKSDDLYRAFEAAFPFEETDDQARAIDEVESDLGRERPMDRLVCGDVGFGKTEVALRAAFRVVMAGRQVAVLVPTTVLAQQHCQTFVERFQPYPVRVEMASRFRTDAENQGVVFGLKEGTVDVVIGTHRLLSKDVHFKRLGLLVIDEEHRFGVAHKERIRALAASVDTLVLTATPIPRTLQMALGDIRDLSLIGTAPEARRPVKTLICHNDAAVLAAAIGRELAREGQVFFVHNRVRDIIEVAERVQELAPGARIAIGHGQMREEKLEQVMLDFVAHRTDILVCTSIIESGLDIPRANTIIIDRADTYGMAQLYQLRGRVGRSSRQAYAYLVVPPIGAMSEDARERVEALARFSDLGSGFSVAAMDLELRGAGNLLGPEQSGSVSAVGFEMFCDLLAEAAAELRGEEHVRELEPEVTFDKPGFIPEEYLPDVGQRLHFYKRLAASHGEEEVERVAADIVDRFGTLPADTEDLVRSMVVKALARVLAVRGVEAGERRLTVHLAGDARVDPEKVIEIVREEQGRVHLTSDLKILVRYRPGEEGGVPGAIAFLRRLAEPRQGPAAKPV